MTAEPRPPGHFLLLNIVLPGKLKIAPVLSHAHHQALLFTNLST